jgi:hypothetical protein
MPIADHTGQGWQAHVERLCRIECSLRGETYQPIPDKVQGDNGLEGVSTDGEGYQCFADQDSESTSDRVNKQKRKIREDLNKLEQYSEYWSTIFGTTKLKKWFLVTPKVSDKAVISYARSRAKVIREQNLPFIDPSFEAFVVTDDHFQRAKDLRAKQAALPLDVSPDDISQKDLDGVKSDFVANTERKLRQVLPTIPQIELRERLDQYLKWYLAHENVLSKVLGQDPELFERLKNFCAQHEETIRFDSDLDFGPPHIRLQSVRESLAEDIDRDFKNLGTATLNILVRGSIASWLGNCPLEFISGANDEWER